MRKGKFIVIEGTDGSGKATQTNLLAQALRNMGRKVQTIAFPQYGQKSAGAVEAYLNGVYGTPKEVGTYRAAIFYAVDRAAARRQIISWLRKGDVVIADRYLASNWAYGGALLSSVARRRYWKWDRELEFGLFKIPKPDRTIVLAVPPRIAQKLILQKRRRGYLGRKKRDAHESDVRYQAKVLQTYRQLARLNRHMRVVECVERARLLSKQEVHQKVLTSLGGMV
ncbi:MAG: dTMP kinase [Candidatus Kerfeldbacteria bacterium]|nr:dTMP kinase [Candidatus Kerfeldbacteria bacterium]